MYRQFDWICQRHQCCISAHGRSELYHPSAAQFEQVCVLGGYGAFDSLAASVLRKQKKRYPQIELVLVLAYLKTRQDISYYDSTVYPPLEAVPRRFAISHRNRWMVESTDVIVAYVLHDWGGAATTLQYAKQKKKPIISCADR